MALITPLAEGAQRLAARYAPPAAKWAAEGFVGLVDRLAKYGPEAAAFGENVRNLRSLSQQTAGTVMQVTRPIVETLTEQESHGLAQVMLGQVPASHAPGLLTPRTVELLRRGQQLAEASGTPFAESLRNQTARISPKVARDGKALFTHAVEAQADPLFQRVVRDRMVPQIESLPGTDEYGGGAKWLAGKLVAGATEGAGGTGTLRNLRALNTATLLGRAVIGNATQSGLTYGVAGNQPTLAALRDLMTQAGRREMTDNAMRLGTLLESGVTDFLRKDLGEGKIARFSSDVLRSTMFNAVERFNRRFSTAVGGHWFDQLAKVANVDERAARHLARHGATDLSQASRERFIQNFVRRTQFRMTPEEMPRILSERGGSAELMRTAIQFKPFGMKAAGLLVDELKHQPAGFLARMALGGAVLGVPASQVRRLTGGSRKEQGYSKQAIEAMAALGTAGLFYDVARAAEGGQKDVLELIGGPSAGLAAETLGGAGQLVFHGKAKPLAKAVIRRIPIVGPAATRLLPSGRQSILP